jgi:hypothetical protein
VWCVATRLVTASDDGVGTRPSARRMSAAILNAVFAAGTPQ